MSKCLKMYDQIEASLALRRNFYDCMPDSKLRQHIKRAVAYSVAKQAKLREEIGEEA